MSLIVPKLGQAIAELAPAYPGVDGVAVDGQVLSWASRNFSTARVMEGQPFQAASNGNAWFAINCPMAVPFAINTPVVVYQLGWVNGTSIGGNVDVGIYDTAWNRIVSTGSTAVSGSGLQAQYVNITDTPLLPGRYYFVKVLDNITASRHSVSALTFTVPMMALWGIQDSATTAFPLPNPLTNMAQAATVVQVSSMLIATRALV